MSTIYIAVDFDGTVVEHKHPNIGKSVGAEPWLRMYAAKGAKLLLWTLRTSSELKAAVKWFEDRKIPLYGVNKNPDASAYADAPKIYAQIFIDDMGYGIPLRSSYRERPCVDWSVVGPAIATRLGISEDEQRKALHDGAVEEVASLRAKMETVEAKLDKLMQAAQSSSEGNKKPWV